MDSAYILPIAAIKELRNERVLGIHLGRLHAYHKRLRSVSRLAVVLQLPAAPEVHW